MITKEPLSLIVPVNETGVFSCGALCVGFHCNGFWIVDGEQHSRVNEHGMTSHFDSLNDNEYTLTLTVIASETMNNSSIQCRYEALSGNMNHITDSATVYLLVVSCKRNYVLLQEHLGPLCYVWYCICVSNLLYAYALIQESYSHAASATLACTKQGGH